MSQPAMSATWDGRWSPLSDFELDEWLFFKDGLCSKENNDSSSKLTKHEIAEQVLHDIEDLGRTNTDYWLDDFPLFEEIQTPKLSEEYETRREQEIKNFNLILDEGQLSSKNDSAVPDFQNHSSEKEDLFSASYENTATFILSNENILYFEEPFGNLTPLQRKCENSIQSNQEETLSKELGVKDDLNFQPATTSWDGSSTENVNKEMSVVDEILKNTALDLWESDTSRSEISSDGVASANSSPKEREVETDDPDWKPYSFEFGERKQVRRSKPYWRGGSQEEKKLRKKEQNKNAATRYRQKKKAQISEILKEEKLLKEKKAKLEEKVADIQSEIKCLKALMRDLFKAKGIIN